MSAETALDDAVEQAEGQVFDDERLVRVIIKIRDAIADLNTEYNERMRVLKDQKKQVEVEVLRRLQERKATQTKTPSGTCFVTESMQITIADEEAFGKFVLEQNDYGFYQKRAKVEHVREYMAANNGALPPGLSVYRELEINTRVPTRKAAKDNSTIEGSDT